MLFDCFMSVYQTQSRDVLWLSPRWHSHLLQLPDSTARRESILALYKITYKGVTQARLDVFLSNWKTSLCQSQLCPLKNDSTLPFWAHQSPNNSGKLPAKLYFNRNLMD